MPQIAKIGNALYMRSWVAGRARVCPANAKEFDNDKVKRTEENPGIWIWV